MSLSDNTQTNPFFIFISSNNRISGTDGNFQSSPIDLGINNYDSVCVSQASIPRSFYNIPNGYNSFTLKEGLLTASVVIPVASYNRINLQIVLQNRLNASSPNGWLYTVSYPNKATQGDTFKYTITVTGNTSQPQLIFTDGMFRQLGFNSNSTNTFVANTLTSSNCINLAFSNRLYIKSNICNGTDVLQEISSYGTYPILGICYFEQAEYDLNTREYNKDSSNSWTFVLENGFSEQLDLNGISWSVGLVFYCRSNTHEIVKSDLLLKNEQRIMELQQKEEELKLKLSSEEDNKDESKTIGFIGNNMQIEKFLPTFPVKPFNSSTSLIKDEPPTKKTKENK